MLFRQLVKTSVHKAARSFGVDGGDGRRSTESPDGKLSARSRFHRYGDTIMFDEIFFPRTAERYRVAPLVEQRERYLVHLREIGARRSTLRKCANDQLSLVRLLKLKEGSRVRL